MRRLVIVLTLVTICNSVSNTRSLHPQFDPAAKLVIVTLDGFRWQEVFRGVDTAIMPGAKPYENREALMPFLWKVVARQGQLAGNRDLGNKMNVSNPYSLSYPGYNELLTGRADPSIYANYKITNRNKTFLESLNQEPAYRNKVAAFASWNVFPYILDKNNSSLYRDVNAGKLQALYEPGQGEHPATRDDGVTFKACLDYVMTEKPSVIFLSFSGTDDAGHAGDYSAYLKQAHRADQYIAELWNVLQTLPQYAGHTSLLITTDHGRGERSGEWGEHGMFIAGSSQTWYGLMGPSVLRLGELHVKDQAYAKDMRQLVVNLLVRH